LFFQSHAPNYISPLSLHDALPISLRRCHNGSTTCGGCANCKMKQGALPDSFRLLLNLRQPCSLTSNRLRRSSNFAILPSVAFTSDRKSTRLNSSHDQISYAVFCLK